MNPYAELGSLVDTTRALDPEEQAELHLEQGFVDRALAIYEALVEAHPEQPYYRHRCDWLARLADTDRRASPRAHHPVDGTLRGTPSPARDAQDPAGVRRVSIRRVS